MQTSSFRTHLPSVLQLALSGLGLAGALGIALTMVGAGVLSFVNREESSQTVSFLSIAANALLIGLLLIPGGALALLRLIGKTPPRGWSQLAARGFRAKRLANIALAAWPLVVLAGLAAGRVPELAWLLLPPLLILAISIPIWWVFESGRRGLSFGPPQRAWGLLSIALVITPILVIIVEAIVLIGLLVLFVLWLQTQPELLRELMAIISRFRDAGDPAPMLEALSPYLRRPGALLSILGAGALILPLVEEMLKPLPLWLWAGRRLSPAEGFTGGLLCGAAFALVESLGFSADSVVSMGLPSVAIARLGTGLLHTVASGLVGWGLATGWEGWRTSFLAAVGRMLLALALAVTLHGLWNLFGLLLGLTGLPGGLQGLPDLAARLAIIAPLAMGVLIATLLAILFGANRKLAAETNP